MNGVPIQFTLNGRPIATSVPGSLSLLHFLRRQLRAYEVKNGCERGDCGACLVLLDGLLVNACLVLAAQIDGSEVTTVKGLGERGRLHPIQEAFIEQGAVQCGFCTPGMILAAKALLDSQPNPSEPEIRRAVAGNYCRCTGYRKILRAVAAAAHKMHPCHAPHDA